MTKRTCNNAACGWTGDTSDCVQLSGRFGGVGPLCPECRETTEPDAPTAVVLDAATKARFELLAEIRASLRFLADCSDGQMKDGDLAREMAEVLIRLIDSAPMPLDTARIDALERQLNKMGGMALTVRPRDRFATVRDLMDYFIAHPDDALPASEAWVNAGQPVGWITKSGTLPTAHHGNP